MRTDVVITRGWPVPRSVLLGRATKYPFADLGVGDSLCVPVGIEPRFAVRQRLYAALSYARRTARVEADWQFRWGWDREEQGWRVWRIA